jgi:hypothetical protein
MVRFTTVYVSCVLYPAPSRDFLLQFGLYRGRGTNAIHDEWIRNLSKSGPPRWAASG